MASSLRHCVGASHLVSTGALASLLSFPRRCPLLLRWEFHRSQRGVRQGLLPEATLVYGGIDLVGDVVADKDARGAICRRARHVD